MPSKKKGLPKGRRKKTEPKESIREKFTEILELPKEVVLNLPKITMIGNGNLMIENYKGIIEYEDGRIRVNTGAGAVKIIGTRLVIKEITSEDMIVDGEIVSLEFLK